MRLAFRIFTYFPFGGMERNFLRIAEACMAKGHTVQVFTMGWQGDCPAGLTITTVPARGITNHGRCQSFVANLERLPSPAPFDLTVGFNRMPGLDLYYAADVCYQFDISRRRTRLARLTPRYRVYAAFERAVFGPESATRIMYLAEQEKEHYIRCYATAEDRFYPLPPGIDKARIRGGLGPASRQTIRRELGLAETDLLLLMVGSDFHRKGADRAIAALAGLPPALRTRSHLVVVGRGKPAGFLRQADRLGVGSRVHFPGGRDDVPRFLAAADLLLHPAVTENTGNAIVEALVAGLPVLATDVCGYAFHVTRAEAGMLIPAMPFRQAAMNDLLTQALSSPAMAQWRQNARRYSDREDLYSRPQVAVEIIERVAALKRQAQAGNQPPPP